jgi:mono/diheme cytochrome c family protein
MLLLSGHALAIAAEPPAQAARGKALFFDENAAVQCGGCHALKGQGTAIGPDLTRLARLTPSAIVMAIRATSTEYVLTVKLSAGGEFPAMPGPKAGDNVQYFDLSAKPPALRKFEPKEISSAKEGSSWKHPPSAASFTPQQLADLVAFIKWASYGEIKTVNPSDTQ